MDLKKKKPSNIPKRNLGNVGKIENIYGHRTKVKYVGTYATCKYTKVQLRVKESH